MSSLVSFKMAERSEAKLRVKFQNKDYLTRSLGSRFKFRNTKPFLAKFKTTINFSVYLQGLTSSVKLFLELNS